MKIGDIVLYKNDWKLKRQWLLDDIYDGLCSITLIRDGKTSNEKNGQIRKNPSIVNLNINEIEVWNT